MTWAMRVLVGGLGAWGLTGCAAGPMDGGFKDVEREVGARTGRRVRWIRETAGDREVADSVKVMLARELGADEAVQIALLNNRNLQAVYEDLGVAQADLVQAGLLRNPVFDAEVRFVEGGAGTGMELAIVQDFLDVFFIPMRKRIAESALEAAKLRVTGAALDLAGRVRAAHVQYVAAEQIAELRRSAASAMEASYELAKRLRAAGNVTELALANERAMHEQARLELSRAEARRIALRERMSVLMGLWGEDTQWSASQRLMEPPEEEISAEAIERRGVEASLELAALRTEINAAGRKLGLTNATALLAELEAGAAAEREPEGDWAVGPAVSAPIPIFDLGQGRKMKARSELERLRHRYWAAAVETRSAARAAKAKLMSARDRANDYRRVMIPLRREITQQTLLHYNAMQLSTFELLAAKQREIEAGVEYVEALMEYWTARRELELILSGRLPEADIESGARGSSASSSAGTSGGGH